MKIEVSFRHTENGRTIDTSAACELPEMEPIAYDSAPVTMEDVASLCAQRLFARCVEVVRGTHDL